MKRIKTNYDYIQSLSALQLAEYIYKKSLIASCGVCEHRDKNECYADDTSTICIDGIYKFLCKEYKNGN